MESASHDPVVEKQLIILNVCHTKVRRDGYAK